MTLKTLEVRLKYLSLFIFVLLDDTRTQARLNKDYTLADNIKKMFNELGFTVTDTKEGTSYEYH